MNYQGNLFSNYSFETSLPAYESNKAEKKRQEDKIYDLIKSGIDNLLQLSEVIGLEQGRVSARVGDLIEAKRVEYNLFTYYKGRKRKKLEAK